MSKLYLIPNFLGHKSKGLIPNDYLEAIYSLKRFVVETEKSARAFLKAIDHPVHQDHFEFFFMDKRMRKGEIPGFFENLGKDESLGLISDAGTPCIADPGSRIVDYALYRGIDVVPFGGLNSIVMALMASGFNGQRFRFIGYLPFDKRERNQAFKEIKQGLQKKETQIFIETPYRNIKLIEELTVKFSPDQHLAVVSNISTPSEKADRRDMYGWLTNTQYLDKIPAVYVLGS